MKKSSIQFELTIPIVVAISLFLGFYGLFSYSVKKDKMMEDLNKSLERTKSRLVKNVTYSLFELDLEAIELNLKSELKKDYLESIQILNDSKSEIEVGVYKNKKNIITLSKNKELFGSDNKKIQGKILNPNQGSKSKEIVIGHYIITINENIIKEELNKEIIFILTTIIFLNIIIGLVIYFLLRKIVVAPLEELSEISKSITEGDYSKRAEKKYSLGQGNEMTLLAKSMNQMTEKVEKLTTGLKKEVDSQTKEIQLQNETFFNILSNLDQGFLILDNQGTIISDPSKQTNLVFQVDPKGVNITDLFGLNFTEKKSFLKWVSHIYDGKIPFKDLLALTSKVITITTGKVISLDYKPIYKHSGKKIVDKVICIFKDITSEKNAQKKIEYANEKSDMILKLIETPIEFLDILDELRDLIHTFLQSPKANPYEEIFRNFHTLKARFSNFKVSQIVKRIHELEEDLFSIMNYDIKKSEEGGGDKNSKLFKPDHEHDEKYQTLVKNLEFKVYNLGETLKLFMKENRQVIEMAQSCYNSGEEFEELHIARDELLKFNDMIIKKFILKNIKEPFGQYLRPIEELSKAQDKSVKVTIGESDIHLSLDRYKDFFSALHHVFRNAVDHGIEDKSERIDQNKKEEATIEIAFKRKGLLFFQVAIKDDGRGIDPLKIREIARKKENLKHLKFNKMTPEELIQIIFEPGFSSKEEATNISGRGIGMDAVKKCITDLEGKVWVESEVGEGTLFVAELPILK